jgi:hypothetical protein
LLSGLLIARWIAAAEPGAVVKGVRYGGGAAAVGLALYLIVSGRWPFAMAALGTALPLILRWRAYRERAKAAGESRHGQRSNVETRMLRMTLDHDSGDLSGTVLAGAKAGRNLADLSLAELLSLLDECKREDPQSAPLLETYLERRFGADWRGESEADAGERASGAHGSTQGRPRASNAMTRQEALEILGLDETATPDQIKEAYRRLMIRLHPDAGGSDYLAAKLNQAKDILLGD